MSNLPVVIQESPDHSRLILCPATLDGMACATILTRALSNVEYQLFCPEDQVYTLFDYPAVKEAPKTRELIFAGFPLPDLQLERVEAALHKTRSPRILWYSHHFWSGRAAETLSQLGVELIVDTRAGTTAEVLLERMEITDDLSRAAAAMAITGHNTQPGNLADWPYVLLALQDEHYELRHAFAPLFGGRADQADPELVEAGREVYQDMKDHIDSSAQYRIEVGDQKIAVIGLPMTFRNYYKLIAQLVEEKLGCQMVILFFDALQQILLMGSRLYQNAPDFWELMERLEKRLDYPVRIFDKNILLIGPAEDLKTMVDRLIAALGENG
jgi:hypothetical protein